MSTINVETIKNPTSSNTVNSEQVIQGSATAWANIDGIGTITIRDSYNVSSVTDTSTGTITVNFATPYPDINFAIFISSRAYTSRQFGIQTTSSVVIHTYNTSTVLSDYNSVSLAILGGV